jgi:predicted homoserine dehydrogenase-like protein
MHISVIGTGYIATRFVDLIDKYKHTFYQDIDLDYILTRRSAFDNEWMKKHPVINIQAEALCDSDIIVDLAGDAKYLYRLIKDYYHNNKIVTFNSEFFVTYPNIHKEFPYLKITEAEGDQPGSFAVLANKIRYLGLEPVCFINHKRFLDYNPAPENMKRWADSYGLSEDITVASTDGTKVSFETAFIANAYGLIVPTNGNKSYYFDEGYPPEGYGKYAYVKFTSNKGISIDAIATKNTNIKDLQYLGIKIVKGGDKNLWSTFELPYHLCQYDIINTVRGLHYNDNILLNTNDIIPRYNVYAISKSWFVPGESIGKGIGGYDVRGELRPINGNENALPIIDCQNVRVLKPISPGTLITKDMVESF